MAAGLFFSCRKGCPEKTGCLGEKTGRLGKTGEVSKKPGTPETQKRKEVSVMARDFAKAFYNSQRWRTCAKAYAASKLYICERCHNKFARHDGKRQRWIVHHKIPLTPDNINDPRIAYGWDNLQFLCIECHNQLHSKHHAGRRCQFDADGNLLYFK